MAKNEQNSEQNLKDIVNILGQLADVLQSIEEYIPDSNVDFNQMRARLTRLHDSVVHGNNSITQP